MVYLLVQEQFKVLLRPYTHEQALQLELFLLPVLLVLFVLFEELKQTEQLQLRVGFLALELAAATQEQLL